MIKKQILHAGVRLVLFAALFAQAAVAANACLRVQPAAVTASSHCEQSDDEINLNLCLCQWADQSGQSPTQPGIAVPTAAVLTVPHAAQCLLSWISPIVAGYAGHDPPIPIRFCSFLN